LTHRVCNQCLGTGQHRGFCPVCLSAARGTRDRRRGQINPTPGVHYITWRTW
jgi:hypothetical protein